MPVIGNDLFISTGAKIIGNVKVGNSCVIGANAVVLKDVPDNCVVAGIPAKIIKNNINMADFK
jgi:serine O-acetyltransferase